MRTDRPAATIALTATLGLVLAQTTHEATAQSTEPPPAAAESSEATESEDAAQAGALRALPPPLSPPADGDYPYADLFAALGSAEGLTVRGRLVLEDDGPVDAQTTTPLKVSNQEELKGAACHLWLSTPDSSEATPWLEVTTDDEGYIHGSGPTPSGLVPGRYTVHAVYEGQVVGAGAARILPPEYAGLVVRSDVDQTYLATDFHSATAMMGLLTETASEKTNLPAMEVIYRALRAGADGQADRPLTYLSGSPGFFKRTLEAHMALDAIEQDGLVLKPMGDIALGELRGGHPRQIIPALEEQVGYKMAALLSLRLAIPPTTGEILMGDDSEADFVVYTLYHRFTAGELTASQLVETLTSEPIAISDHWRQEIARLAPEVQARLSGHPPPVKAIYINHTAVTGDRFEVDEWAVPGVTRYHQGAWPLALDLWESGWISDEAVEETRARLTTLGAEQPDAQAPRQGWSKAGLRRYRHRRAVVSGAREG